jgi:hypothetical protein
MTVIDKPGTTLDKSGIVNKTLILAGDVRVPLIGAENLMAVIREMVSVSASDAKIKHLNDAISAGSGIIKTILNPGGDEQLEISTQLALAVIDEDTLVSSASAINISGISSDYSDWLLVAALRSTRAASTIDTIIARVEADATAGNYFAQRLKAASTSVGGAELIGTDARLMADAEIPAASSPAGAFGMLTLWLAGVNSAAYGKTAQWQLASPQAQTSGNIRYIAGTGFYNQQAVVDELNLTLDNGDFEAGSSWKLYGVRI